MPAFRFKHFAVEHDRSSMKVGVDAVLLGAWADVSRIRSTLDVGCGCGVIALEIAQRSSEAIVEAIDIDESSVVEARHNFRLAPWSDRLSAECIAFSDYCARAVPGSIDLMVSNPPYFSSGIEEPDTPRLRARHAAELSPISLIEGALKLLSPTGCIAMVLPAEQEEVLLSHATTIGLYPLRLCHVRGHEEAPVKRLLCEFGRQKPSAVEVSELTLEARRGVPSPQYHALCHDFYLKW